MPRLRTIGAIVLRLGVLLCAFTTYLLWPSPAPRLVFPDGKRFAFTIIDDTDMATLDRLRPVYAILERYGLRTTKTVWVRASNEIHPASQGQTLSDPEYRAFVVDLRRKGFEVALHGVRGGSSLRAETIEGLEEFRRAVGSYPRIHVNHSINRDNLYWGPHLYSLAPLRWAAAYSIPFEFSGHDERSPYFWGDQARAHIDYVRRFTFPKPNLYRLLPQMPYRIANMPYVKWWFPTANGDRLPDFEALLSDANLDALEREGGVCLVYAHLGSGSYNYGATVNPRFEQRIRALTARQGWFVPASEILDYLRAQPGWTGEVGWRERARMEVLFVLYRLGLR